MMDTFRFSCITLVPYFIHTCTYAYTCKCMCIFTSDVDEASGSADFSFRLFFVSFSSEVSSRRRLRGSLTTGDVLRGRRASSGGCEKEGAGGTEGEKGKEGERKEGKEGRCKHACAYTCTRSTTYVLGKRKNMLMLQLC